MSDNNATAAEPSMEEILASIRQIINQPEAGAEGDAAASQEPLELTADTTPEDDDILELSEILDDTQSVEMTFEETTPQVEPEMEPEPVAVVEPEPVFTPEPVVAPEPVVEASMEELITGATAAAATAQLSSLAQTLHQEKTEHSLPVGNGGRTLESMVVEAIKPLLREWLDEHLPSVVERIVQQEVEKLTRRIGG